MVNPHTLFNNGYGDDPADVANAMPHLMHIQTTINSMGAKEAKESLDQMISWLIANTTDNWRLWITGSAPCILCTRLSNLEDVEKFKEQYPTATHKYKPWKL